MRLFLQIDVGDWKQRNYSNLLVPYASSLADDLIGTDIDNESEAAVVDLVIKLTEQVASVFVFISVKQSASLGSAEKLIRYLQTHQSKTHLLVMLGEHPAIEMMVQNFDERFVKAKNTEEVRKLVQDFAKKSATPGRTSGLVP